MSQAVRLLGVLDQLQNAERREEHDFLVGRRRCRHCVSLCATPTIWKDLSRHALLFPSAAFFHCLFFTFCV